MTEMTSIYFNDHGDAVLALQRGIIAAGGSLPRFGVDGHLGAETWRALGELAAQLDVPIVSVDVARAHRAAVPSRLIAHCTPVEAAPLTGLVIAGERVPGTEWIRRDPRAWWDIGERGTRRRAPTVDLLIGHWTAGNRHAGEDAAAKVVRAMKARKRDDGSPLNVGIQFVISWDGIVTQTTDLVTAATQVGTGAVNARAIGVETCWPGTASWAKRLGIEGETELMHVGPHDINTLVPSPGLLAAWVRLAETLAALEGRGGIHIPRRVPATMARHTVSQQATWTGAQEHAHVARSTKVDAAGHLMRALVGAGWAREAPV